MRHNEMRKIFTIVTYIYATLMLPSSAKQFKHKYSPKTRFENPTLILKISVLYREEVQMGVSELQSASGNYFHAVWCKGVPPLYLKTLL